MRRCGAASGSIPTLQDGIGELGGRTVGLVGYGAIPRLLAPVLTALGCRLIYTSRTPRADALGEWRTLDALLAEADVVSLHLPLTDDTARSDRRGGAGAHEAGRDPDQHRPRRPGRSVGADRGAGERHGWPAPASTCSSHEPHDASDALFRLPNVVLTPHIAWLTTGTFDRSFALAAENCRRLAAGEALLHRVV